MSQQIQTSAMDLNTYSKQPLMSSTMENVLDSRNVISNQFGVYYPLRLVDNTDLTKAARYTNGGYLFKHVYTLKIPETGRYMATLNLSIGNIYSIHPLTDLKHETDLMPNSSKGFFGLDLISFVNNKRNQVMVLSTRNTQIFDGYYQCVIPFILDLKKEDLVSFKFYRTAQSSDSNNRGCTLAQNTNSSFIIKSHFFQLFALLTD